MKKINRKTKFMIFALPLIFGFISCTALIPQNQNENQDKPQDSVQNNDTTMIPKKSYISFDCVLHDKTASARTIIPTVDLSSYKYSVSGKKGEAAEKTYIDKKSLTDLQKEKIEVESGKWTFTITAYGNDNTEILSGSITENIIEDEQKLSVVLHATSGGTGGAEVTLKFPSGKGVAKVTAGIYDSPIADDASTEGLTATTSGEWSSVKYENKSVPSGTAKFVNFFLYDSNNICIGTYSESIYVVKGRTSKAEAELQNINLFTAKVSIMKNGKPWVDSGKTVTIKKGDLSYTLVNAEGSNEATGSVPLGTYDVFIDGKDTGVKVTVKMNGCENSELDIPVLPEKSYVFTGEKNKKRILPKDTSASSWKSADETIATVDNDGNITGIKVGETTIKATILGTEYSCAVKVYDVPEVLSRDYFRAHFPDYETITEFDIPFGVTKGTEWTGAFDGCKMLERVSVPETMTTITEQFFIFCTSLKSIELPESVVRINAQAFNACTSLETISIGKNTIIDPNALMNCSSIKEIIIDKENPNHVFENGILYADNKKTLQLYAAANEATSFTIPAGVTKIDALSFATAKNLKTLTIPTNVEIGDTALIGFKGEIIIDSDNPNYVTENKTILFNKDKTKLYWYSAENTEKTYTVPKTVKSIEDGAFSNCTNLETVILQDCVKTIKGTAFGGCENLKTIQLPNTLEQIYGWGAFSGCTSLESITLPSSIKEIGDASFNDCTKLKTLTINAETPPKLSGSPFPSNLEKIIVPAYFVDAYKSAWYDFANIISPDHEHKPAGDYTINAYKHGKQCEKCPKMLWEDHDYDDGVTDSGTTTYTCKACGHTITRTTHTHTFATEWTTSDNYHWHVATCEHTTELKDRAKHTEDSGTQTSEPTCTEEGTITYSCETCEKALRTEIIPALGHTWNDGEVTTAPTCTTDGVKTFTCTVCGETRTETTILAKGHMWEKTGTVYKCSVCNETTTEGNISCKISVVSGDISLVNTDNTFTATLDDVTTFKWYFNGKELLETSDTCDLSGELRGLAIGYYELIVTAVKNGVTYSSTTKIRIEH